MYMATFKQLSEFLNKLEGTSSRLELRDLLKNYLQTLTPKEGAILTYFITGRVAPKFVDAEFNISEKTIQNALSQFFDIPQAEIKQLIQQYLDYGGVFMHLQKPQSKQNFTITQIYSTFWDIIKIKGKGSQEAKLNKILNTLKELSPVEGKFFIRILLGRTRLGISERTILDALAQLNGTPKQAKQILEHALGLTSDIGHITFLMLNGGLQNVQEKATFTPGIPVAAKLVEREPTIEKILERIPQPYEEPKYDGLRCQVHIYKETQENLNERIWHAYFSEIQNSNENITLFTKHGNNNLKIKLFSRNLESLTDMFPEIVEGFTVVGQKLFEQNPNAQAFVFDGEVVGYNPNTQEFSPFKDTMTRRRKYNVEKAASQTPVRIFTFDTIYWNNKDLLNTPLKKRKELLNTIRDIHEDIMITPTHSPENLSSAEKIFLTYVEEGLEGVIFKDPQSLYTPGLRKFDWIKFKKAMKKELADTIDVVVLGYYQGTGKWAKLGIGAFLAGTYDKEKDEFLTITKVGTGITEEQWIKLKKLFDKYKIDHKLANVNIPKQLMPDVLLEPTVVLEIEADEITKSPTHSAGYALRFPRFKRIRDKAPTDITTLQEIKDIYQGK